MTLMHGRVTANSLFPPRPYPWPRMLHVLSGVGNGGVWCGRAPRQGTSLLGLVEKDGGYPPGDQPQPWPSYKRRGEGGVGVLIHTFLFLYPPLSSGYAEREIPGPGPGP